MDKLGGPQGKEIVKISQVNWEGKQKGEDEEWEHEGSRWPVVGWTEGKK